MEMFTLIVSFFISIFILFKLTRTKSAPNLPPGPRKLPFIGNLHNLMGAKMAPHRALYELANKYGPLMHLQLGEVSTVVVSSPDAAREIMKTHDINFSGRPFNMTVDILTNGFPSLTFRPADDHWRLVRKICTLELLSNKRVQSFRCVRERVFSELIKWMASNEGSPVNFTRRAYASTYDFVLLAVVGKNAKQNHRLLEILAETIVLGTGFDVTELYPSIKLLEKFSSLRKRVTVLNHESEALIEDTIQDATKLSNRGEKQETLLDVLLAASQDDGLKLSLSMENIKAIIKEILATGSDTSATTLNWAMAELMKNPLALEKAQNEVRRVFNNTGFVDESCIHELKYLKATIKETLRLHSPVPLLLPRECSESREINGYVIPSKTRVIINGWAINRDPKYWKDSECFQPERFVNISLDYKGTHFEFIPFGSGRRMCPGMSFGLANVELPLAMLLYHFDWKLGDGMRHEDLDMTEEFGVTLKKEKDLFLVPLVTRPLARDGNESGLGWVRQDPKPKPRLRFSSIPS